VSEPSGRGVAARLADIAEEVAVLRRYTDGVTYGDFVADPGLRRIVQSSVLVISEAARHLPDDLTERTRDVPWHRIRAIGNIIRHEYFRVDPAILWGIVEESLDDLEAAIAALGHDGKARDP